jgi:hypothetical protein
MSFSVLGILVRLVVRCVFPVLWVFSAIDKVCCGRIRYEYAGYAAEFLIMSALGMEITMKNHPPLSHLL